MLQGRNEKNPKIPIGVIDSSAETVRVLENHFKKSEHFELAFAVPTFEKFKWINRQKPKISLLLVEIDLPYQSGLDSLPALKKLLPAVPIVIFTTSDLEVHILQAIRRGAAGYFLKRRPLNVLEEQILEALANNGSLLCTVAARVLIEHFNAPSHAHEKISNIQLTEKEKLVVRYISKGKTYEAVSLESGLKIDSVRYYIKRVYRKLNVNNKVEMLNLAAHLNLDTE